MKTETCADRIQMHFDHCIEDIKEILNDGDFEKMDEYGLSWEYVEAGTYDDQGVGYHRWLLSWGGPSDEFRFYDSRRSGPRGPERVEYRFHDWFDGAGLDLEGDEKELLLDVFDNFADRQGLFSFR